MATAQERLDEARAALHQLAIGKSVVSVQDSNGESVSFGRTNINALRAYIRDLDAEVGGTPAAVKPLAPFFGC